MEKTTLLVTLGPFGALARQKAAKKINATESILDWLVFFKEFHPPVATSKKVNLTNPNDAC